LSPQSPRALRRVHSGTGGARNGTHVRRTAKALALAALGAAALAAPAGAALNSPSPIEERITVFPMRDFIAMDQYAPNTRLHVRVLRDGHVVGTATGITDAIGFLEVNHPGGVCWDQPSTPDLIDGDIVQVSQDPEFDSVQNDVDQVITAAIQADAAFDDGHGNIIMKGTAQAVDANGELMFTASGAPVPANIANMESRIVAPDIRDLIGKRDLRAPGGIAGQYTGVLSYDAPGSIRWTAVFSGLDQDEIDIALAGQSRILSWMETGPADERLGVTIYEADEIGGPGFGGCPNLASWAVTGSNPANVNLVARNLSNLRISGVSNGASLVEVTLDDEGNPDTPAIVMPGVVPNPATGNQTWSVDIPMSQVLQLDDGALTASALYTVGQRQVGEVQVGERVVGQRKIGEIIVGQQQVGERVIGQQQVGERQVGERQVERLVFDANNQPVMVQVVIDGVPQEVPVLDAEGNPMLDADGNPIMMPLMRQATETVTEPIMQPIFEPITEPIFEPIIQELFEDIVEPIMEPVFEPIKIGGATRTIYKDLFAPAAPVATPGEGQYLVPQSVELSIVAPEDMDGVIRYTRNGTVPSATNGTTFGPADLQVSANQTIKARVMDPAGNLSPIAGSCASAVDNDPAGNCVGWFRYVIGGAPAAPSTPDMILASDTGASPVDDLTRVAVPTFVGTAESGVALELLDGSTVVASGNATESGTYSLTPSAPLADGSHAMMVRATNTLGSTDSGVNGIQIDTVAPTVIADPPGGVFEAPQSVSLVASEAGTTIRYSIVGAVLGNVYTGPIAIAADATLSFQATDGAGNASAVGSADYVIDTAGPTVAINAPAAGATVSGNALIGAAVNDPNGVASVQFTIDGVDFGDLDEVAPFQIDWDTTAVPNGTYTLAAVATDNVGNQTTAAGRTVIVDNVDAVDPVVQAPSITLQSLSTAAGTSVAATETTPVRIAWSATHPSGIARYTLERSTNNFQTQTRFNMNGATAVTQQLAPGTYQYRVVALANDGATATGPVQTVRIAINQGPATFGQNQNSSNFWNGSTRFATAAGTVATYNFSGTSVAWVSTRAGNRGRAQVLLDGVSMGTVDLFNPTLQARRLVFVRNGLTPGQHTLQVRVLNQRNASSTGTRVDVDGFASLQ
jgi:hypothetical protein